MKQRLNYVVSGPENAPVLVLAHGLATDLTMWDDVAVELQRDYRIVRYDSRGHGRSPIPTQPFTLEELASDVVTFLDDLQIEKAFFAGLSMGGMVGMTLGLSSPERLSGLVVCDARGDAPQAYQDSWSQRISKVRSEGLAAIVDATIDRWFTDQFKNRVGAVDAVRQMMMRTSETGYIFSAQALQSLDCTSRLPTLTVPTLYLVGSEDAGAPPDVMRRMHELTPNSQFIAIAGAGHISALEQPGPVSQAIAKFIGGLA